MSENPTSVSDASIARLINQPPAPADEPKTSFWPGFWTVAIPAYTYFSGIHQRSIIWKALGLRVPVYLVNPARFMTLRSLLSTVVMNDGAQYTGHFYHKDSEYLYVLTEAEAYSLPIESIKHRSRSLQTKTSK